MVFLDEVNTSAILGSVQDVMIDNSLEGSPLPHNIFWVCATNPYKQQEAFDPLSAASGDKGFRDHYQVRPVPEAMELVKWHFGSLSDDAVLDYIQAKSRELRPVLSVEDEPVPSGAAYLCTDCALNHVPPTLQTLLSEPVRPDAASAGIRPPTVVLSEPDLLLLSNIVHRAHTIVKETEGDR